MAGPYFYDRVLQTTTTTGTGTLSLGADIPNYQNFADTVGNGNTCYIVIEDTTNNAWELCLSTYTTGTPSTLTRGTLYGSSTGSRVSFAAGTKRVYLVMPSHELLIAGGKAGGQNFYGGTAASENLYLGSTFHSTKGYIELADKTYLDKEIVFTPGGGTLTTNYNDYALTNKNVFVLTADADGRTITGISGGEDGKCIRVLNSGTKTIILSHQSSSSSAANRIIVSFAADFTLMPNEFVDLYYDGTNSRWYCTPTTKNSIGALVYNNANFSHTSSGSWVDVTHNSEKYDTNSFHSTSTNTNRITITAGFAGKYMLIGSIQWASNATGFRGIRFLKNATTGIGLDLRTANNGITTNMSICAATELAVGDYVTLNSYQDSGGTLSIDYVPDYSPFFTVVYLGK